MVNTTPHLLAEDRPDFDRALDEALRDARLTEALRAPGPHLNAAQLRTKAASLADTIAAAAEPEYQRYTALRDAGPPAPLGLTDRLRSEEGAGLLPVLTVLTPILAGSGGVLLLLIGYAVRGAAPELPLAHAVVTAGWISLAVGGAALLVGIVGLLLTALRDGAAGTGGQEGDLAEAHRLWQIALRERALLPWLLANLHTEPAPLPAPRATTRPGPPGYSSPGFTSPGTEGVTGADGHTPRPAEFTGPGYTSPDFTGPDEV
ncbi:membrane protein [Kitasatospora sp. CMC57]|uniref:Membrane protein n=1 Tax=Kitasatospora sp. CMC57 TaxID=3231513 RepID=A0AB33JW99_9ACTN